MNRPFDLPVRHGAPWATLLVLAVLSAQPACAVDPNVIPLPASVIAGQGSFRISAQTRIVSQSNSEARRVALYFADLLAASPGIRLSVTHGPDAASTATRPNAASAATRPDAASPTSHSDASSLPGGRIRFELTSTHDTAGSMPSPEGYTLDITPVGVRASASDVRGLLYAAVTLWQLSTAQPDSLHSSPSRPGPSVPETTAAIELPAMRIVDGPRFPWRGLMLDSARHYQSEQDILQLIDWMALHKLNTLHWHLTDDQAWRLEIKRFPRLTQVGAWRVPAGQGPAADLDPRTGQPKQYGGYYSQQAVRSIVAHASQRNITIVPEIDVPGHATAALVAYPKLAAAQPAPARVPADWGIYPNLYNAEESTFRFLEQVLGEVIQLFPGQYVHIGGDEVITDQWKNSPRVQQRMRELGVDSEKALHGYFVSRLDRFLSAHGRRLIGWDEILEAGLPAQATVTSWRGIDGAVTAAAGGHDSVLSPDPTLYLDHLPGDLPDEPPGRSVPISLEVLYRFEPGLKALSAQQSRHVLGLQANLWTEHVRTIERVQLMAFPRLAAVAEVGWSPQDRLDWREFVARLPAQLARYRALGIHASDDVFAVKIRALMQWDTGRVHVALTNQAAAGEIRYTLDGSEPGPAATLYKEELDVPAAGSIRAGTFVAGRVVARITGRALDAPSLARRSSRELRSCTNKLLLSLEDDAPVQGARAIYLIDIMNPCWIYEHADLSRVTAIRAAVGQVPFNYQLGGDLKNVQVTEAHRASGELEVRLDGCDGERIAALSLAPALHNPAVTELPVQTVTPRAGVHDLCLRFTQHGLDPMWAIDWIQLLEPSWPRAN